jgi:hypothetical protein
VKPQYSGSFEGLWVHGLAYTTSSGLTGRLRIGANQNMYDYHEGDAIIFNFGSLRLPSVPGVAQASLMDMFQVQNQNSYEIRNLMRLLLTVTDQQPVLGNAALVHDPSTSPGLPETYASTTRNVFVTLDDLKLPPAQFATTTHVTQFLAAAGKSQLASLSLATDYWIESQAWSRLNLDSDPWPNLEDLDDDEDGVPDVSDAFPWDADESVDADGNGIGDNGTTKYTPLALAPYTGEGSTLPFAFHDIAFDHTRGRLFVSTQADKSLSVFDADSGALLSKITFDFATARMAFNADRSKLFVLLQTREPTFGIPLADQKGYVAEIDAANLAVNRQFQIRLDPFDIAVTMEGHLIVSGASTQDSPIDLYDGNSGALLSSVTSAASAFLGYDGVHGRLFVAANEQIAKYQVNGSSLVATGIRNNTPVSPGTNIVITPAGDLWVTPDGQKVMSSNGVYYSTDKLELQSWLPNWISGIDFDSSANNATVINPTAVLQRYSLPDFTSLAAIPFNRTMAIRAGLWGQALTRVYTRGPYVYIVQTRSDGQMTLTRKPFP